MNRIAIVGCAGAGKSTMAMELGHLLGLPVHHLDRLYWKPGWVAPERNEWVALQQTLVQDDRWIVDGNYGSTLPIRLQRADTVIFLDLPRFISLWRVIKRRIQRHNRLRPDMAEGCQEKIGIAFLRLIWNYPTRTRPTTLKLLARCAAGGTTIIWLRSSREVQTFLDQLRHGKRTLSTGEIM